MKIFKRFFNSISALLLAVLICEIVGGLLMFALIYFQFYIMESANRELMSWAIACALGTNFFSIFATRILRMRAKKLGADIII